MTRVDMLIATYNGEELIEYQLSSVLKQSYNNIRLIIRDDGSTDGTEEIIKSYAERYGDRIVVIEDNYGHLGAAQNFSKLLEYTDADYIMFCDQDDIWFHAKVEKTLNRMIELENIYGKLKPILVHTDLIVVDQELNILSESFWKYQHLNPKEKRLNSLLLQNNITGCTVMANKALRDLSASVPQEAMMHDQWCGLIASTFGIINYLSEPTIFHIMHGKNTIGAEAYSLLKLFLGSFKKNPYHRTGKNFLKKIAQAKQLLNIHGDMLCQNEFRKQREVIQNFTRLEKVTRLERLKILLKYNIKPYGFIRIIWHIFVIISMKPDAWPVWRTGPTSFFI